jgi:hypothetical protein
MFCFFEICAHAKRFVSSCLGGSKFHRDDLLAQRAAHLSRRCKPPGPKRALAQSPAGDTFDRCVARWAFIRLFLQSGGLHRRLICVARRAFHLIAPAIRQQ